jgi:hypothetical protein
MKSSVVKRSIVLAGHKTSVSLEDAFWQGLKDIAKTQRKTLSDLVGSIDIDREHGNLTEGGARCGGGCLPSRSLQCPKIKIWNGEVRSVRSQE